MWREAALRKRTLEGNSQPSLDVCISNNIFQTRDEVRSHFANCGGGGDEERVLGLIRFQDSLHSQDRIDDFASIYPSVSKLDFDKERRCDFVRYSDPGYEPFLLHAFVTYFSHLTLNGSSVELEVVAPNVFNGLYDRLDFS